jgi:hypothetical protein
METDHISDTRILYAYNQGWNSYPMGSKKKNRYPLSEKIEHDAWESGYEAHMKEPGPVSFSL